MMQNYQDAMAICRTYGNPDLFITFIANPKWPEIAEMLKHIPGQKGIDRPEVATRVFKIKLNEMMDDLTKHNIFGKTRAGNTTSKIMSIYLLLYTKLCINLCFT